MSFMHLWITQQTESVSHQTQKRRRMSQRSQRQKTPLKNDSIIIPINYNVREKSIFNSFCSHWHVYHSLKFFCELNFGGLFIHSPLAHTQSSRLSIIRLNKKKHQPVIWNRNWIDSLELYKKNHAFVMFVNLYMSCYAPIPVGNEKLEKTVPAIIGLNLWHLWLWADDSSIFKIFI